VGVRNLTLESFVPLDMVKVVNDMVGRIVAALINVIERRASNRGLRKILLFIPCVFFF